MHGVHKRIGLSKMLQFVENMDQCGSDAENKQLFCFYFVYV